MPKDLYTHEQFVEMEAMVTFCEDTSHLHVILGMVNEEPPEFGEFIYRDEERDLWFRPISELLFCLN